MISERRNWHLDEKWVTFGISVLGCFVIIFIKAFNIDAISDLLWAEDAAVFLAQAHEHGIYSLVVPQAGYLNLFPRFVSYIASLFEINWQPLILLLGSLASYAITILILVITLKSQQVKSFIIVATMCLLFFQPMGDEVLLNITNCQWFIGSALIIYAIAYNENNKPCWNALIALSFGLTGPFAIIVMPVLAVKYFLLKDKRNAEFLFFLFIAVVIQITFLSTNIRTISREPHIEKNISVIVEAARVFFLGFYYSIDNLYIIFLLSSLIFLSIISISYNFKYSKNINSLFYILFVFFTFFIFTVYTLIDRSSGSYTYFINDIYDNNRYLIIPHFLLLIFIIIATHRLRYILYANLAGFFLISLYGFSYIERDHINFSSFLNFSNYQTVFVATNPLGGKETGKNRKNILLGSPWIFKLAKSEYKVLPPDRIYTFQDADITSEKLDLSLNDNTLDIVFKKIEPIESGTIKFTKPIECTQTNTIGIEFVAKASFPVRLEFRMEEIEETKNMTSGFLTHGSKQERLQIAFPFHKDHGKLSLKITTFPYSSEAKVTEVRIMISELKLFCLP